MADQTQPDIQYVQTKNRAREYELKQKEKGNPYTLQELKASHHNHMLDYEIKTLMNKLKT